MFFTKKNFFFIFFSIHIIIIFLVCLRSITHTINTSAFFIKNKSGKETVIEKGISFFLKNPVIHFYTNYSGTRAPYGYFAPNVASSYIIQFNFLDKKGEKISSEILPPFKQIESINRYTSFLGLYQETFKSMKDSTLRKKDTLKIRYLDAVIKSMNKSLIRKTQDDVSSIHSILYLYDQPTIHSYRLGYRRAKLVILKDFTTKK